MEEEKQTKLMKMTTKLEALVETHRKPNDLYDYSDHFERRVAYILHSKFANVYKNCHRAQPNIEKRSCDELLLLLS